VPAGPPEDALDLGTPDLEPLPGEVVPAAEATDDLPLPESLSLDDLLAAGPTSAGAALPAEPVSAGAEPTESIFELSDASASLLPMVETGTGEPPALSVDDLLLPAGDETAPEDTLTMELPEFDLTPLPGADASAATDLESAAPAAPHEEAALGELLLQDAGESVRGAVEPEPAAAAAPFESLSSPQVVEEASEWTEPCATDAAAETLESHVAELVAEPPAFATLVAPVAEPPAPAAPAVAIPSEVAAMREAVTERVTSELKRELSEKLLDRFEKIVWEVVPDLAEILITKEIERIRRLAEEEKPS
jgi:hypothetical protein